MRRHERDAGRFLPWIVAVVLVTLIVPLLITVVVAAFRPGFALPFDAGPFTADNFTSLVGSRTTHRLLLNTLLYVAASLAVGLVLAVALVWLTERTDMPFRNALPALLFIPLVVPSALSAMGWVLLGAPQTGFLNLGIRALAGLRAPGPVDIYSFAGLVWITGVGIVPSMYFMLNASFKNMDAQLEEAGKSSGAPTLKVLRRITLPLMLPSLSATTIYYVIIIAELFEVPLVIGFNADFRVLSIQIYDLVHPTDAGFPEYGRAAAYGVLAVMIGVGLAVVYMRLARKTYRYAIVKGQRQAARVVKLGRWRYVAIAAVFVYLFFSDVLPLLAILWNSLFPTWTAPSIHALSRVSLDVYRSVLMDGRWAEAVRNTVLLVILASTLCVLLATLASWAVVRSKAKWVRWLDVLAFIPRAVPGVILALAILLISVRTPLYGTLWVLVIAHTINYLPYCVRLLNSTLLQIHQELEEAARASGANVGQTLLRVVFPLMRHAIANCWLWVIAHSARDFTFILMLGSANNVVTSNLMWQSWVLGDFSQTSAMAVMLILALMMIVVPLRYKLGRGTEL